MREARLRRSEARQAPGDSCGCGRARVQIYAPGTALQPACPMCGAGAIAMPHNGRDALPANRGQLTP